MQLLAILPFALAAFVSAQDTISTTSSVPYTNAFTTFLTQTDSLGVVTGQPSVITSQPAAATSQESAAIVPAGFSGLTTVTAGNSSYTVSVGNGVTSIVKSTPTPTTQSATGASASGASASASSSSGAAAAGHIKAGVGALAAAGGFFAIFL
jgi:hypothetical protein